MGLFAVADSPMFSGLKVMSYPTAPEAVPLYSLVVHWFFNYSNQHSVYRVFAKCCLPFIWVWPMLVIGPLIGLGAVCKALKSA